MTPYPERLAAPLAGAPLRLARARRADIANLINCPNEGARRASGFSRVWTNAQAFLRFAPRQILTYTFSRFIIRFFWYGIWVQLLIRLNKIIINLALVARSREILPWNTIFCKITLRFFYLQIQEDTVRVGCVRHSLLCGFQFSCERNSDFASSTLRFIFAFARVYRHGFGLFAERSSKRFVSDDSFFRFLSRSTSFASCEN